MPYFIRARTYLRYAEEEFRRGQFRDSFLLAAKAIWALSQIEAPKESPDPESLLAALSQAVEPEVARFFQKGWQRLQKGASPDEARELAREALLKAREILAPILGPLGR